MSLEVEISTIVVPFHELSHFLHTPDFHFGHFSGKGVHTAGLIVD